jgi:aminopeptidase N
MFLAGLMFLGGLGTGLGMVPAVPAPVGIPHELAVERKARVSELRYGLEYRLVPHAAATEGVEHLRFQLRENGAPLLLDFRDGKVESLAVNGAVAQVVESNGHLVLPAAALHAGANEVEVHFAANVAAAAKAITRFEDHDDGSEYLYTLFVPMDADMAFPCFDQPDLKGRFTLTLTAPDAWTVISNTNPVAARPAGSGERTTSFAETEPISTYLFSYAAGPFVKVHPVAGLPGLYVRKSKAKAAESEAPEVQQMAADGMQHLAEYFAQPFPFPKYDMVLIPGFAFGGMEHAGSTFLREESVLFRTAPTKTNLFSRDIVVLHELTHQWFGDFTTMKWFDDLWLKEGFAQYMAYQTLATLHPRDEVWKRFYESIKPGAYGIDETQGTTPIYQNIANLKDAKSAYGAIVYSKAPGVIKQLAYVLGEENFRKGLQLYLSEHRYGNAQWSDLVRAFERVSGQSLGAWAEMWIRHRGMPQVDVTWSCTAGKVSAFRATQHDVLGGDALWPIASEAMLGYADGTSRRVNLRLTTASADVPAALGAACPAFVFANAQDEGYGLFLLDEKSRAYVTEHLGAMGNVFDRALLWGSLWESVRQAQLEPRAYLDLALTSLPRERDEAVMSGVLDHSATALHRYVGAATRTELTARFSQLAVQGMTQDQDQDLRIVWFRRMGTFGQNEAGRGVVKALLEERTTVPGVQLRPQDRWSLVTTLIAYGDPEADKFLAAEAKRDPSGDGRKFAYIAEAARPDTATKKHYFDDYLHNGERSEDWIEGSLGAFNSWNQTALSEPYLRPALEELDQIKRQRKIFFLVGWLNAFIDGQVSGAADATVHGYLKDAALDADLRLKILEVVDELDRTVAIRKRWAVQ